MSDRTANPSLKVQPRSTMLDNIAKVQPYLVSFGLVATDMINAHWNNPPWPCSTGSTVLWAAKVTVPNADAKDEGNQISGANYAACDQHWLWQHPVKITDAATAVRRSSFFVLF